MAEEKKEAAAAPAAPAAPEAAAAEEKEAPAGPKLIMGMPLINFIVIALNALVMLGGTGFIIWAMLVYKKPPITDTQVVTEIQKKAEKKKPVEEGRPGELFVENYAEMTVNLRTQPGAKNHYATVEVSLACPTEKCQSELKSIKAKVEDTVQGAIATRTYTELNSLETKFRLKHEITQKVNSLMKESAIVDVYFQNFVVQ